MSHPCASCGFPTSWDLCSSCRLSKTKLRALQCRTAPESDLARARQAGFDEAREQAAEVAEMWSDNPKSVSAKIRAMRPRDGCV